MDVLLVDPSLFTAPYDAALSGGLIANGVSPRWATRALRVNEEANIDRSQHLSLFYPWTDGPNRRVGAGARAMKGIEHAAALRRLVRTSQTADLVHFQWTPVPKLDERAIRSIRRHCPVVLTVHDAVPYNGKAVSPLQTAGLRSVYEAVDRIIVHTENAAEALIDGGADRSRVAIVPHGLLPLHDAGAAKPRDDKRWQIVQFGKIQHYKGVDVLIEAVGRLDAESRSRLRVIVAGEPQFDVTPLFARAAALNLGDTLEFRPARQSEAEMADLLGSADAFVFPYRAIEASGVLLLVANAGKWLIASDLGLFSELIGSDETAGRLVPSGNVAALAEALMASIGRKPVRSIAAGVPDWAEIGRITLDVYEAALADWRAERVSFAA